MPVDWSRYPKNWPEVRARIMARAGGKCEWCKVEQYAVGYRDKDGSFCYAAGNQYLDLMQYATSYAEAKEVCDFHNEQDVERYTVVVLTIAHLGTQHRDGTPGDKHDKMDCRDENLAALCQRCHLNYDRDEHLENAAVTRDRKRGQPDLLRETTIGSAAGRGEE